MQVNLDSEGTDEPPWLAWYFFTDHVSLQSTVAINAMRPGHILFRTVHLQTEIPNHASEM